NSEANLKNQPADWNGLKSSRFSTTCYTPSHNDMVDPDALSPIMGFPAYADMIVRVKKVK
uniref:hypothetical protein n=1 Tax=Trichlorobacter lovleyi TaxID=313985 RepID=UPI0023F4E7D7